MNKTLVAFTLLIATSFAAITSDTTLSTSTTLSSSSGIQMYGTTNDYIGQSVSNAGDFNKDGVEDFLVGTKNNKAYLVFGSSTARTAALDLSSTSNAATSVLKFLFTATTTAAKLPATSQVVVSAAGDQDGDGYDDVAFGIPAWIGTSSTPSDIAAVGIVVVYYGTTNTAITALTYSTTVDLNTPASVSNTKYFIVKNTDTSADANGKMGIAMASPGDIYTDNLGRDDFLIGAPGAVAGDGAVYIIKGTTSKRTGDVSVNAMSTNGFTVKGQNGGAKALGNSVAGVGDIDGDGKVDAVIGESAGDYAFILYGGSGVGDVTLTTTQPVSAPFYSVIQGPGTGLFGYNVGLAGDINNDGANDIFVGEPHGGTTNTGKVYIIKGTKANTGLLADITSTTIANQIIITGPAVSSFYGQASDGGNDINNDGIDDFITCAPYVDWTGGSPTYTSMIGKCYVIYGKLNFPTTVALSTTLTSSTSPAGFTITGITDTGFGQDVSVVGATSGGGDNFIISAPQSTANSIASAGSVWLFYGVAPSTPTGSGFRLGASVLIFVSFVAALMF